QQLGRDQEEVRFLWKLLSAPLRQLHSLVGRALEAQSGAPSLQAVPTIHTEPPQKLTVTSVWVAW
ncbi:MAG: hypothetical protein EB072_21800, partial [Betaproteobacteria bacterium]|nr:hypothetical protein [Betaproteobacteria bacterium]